MSFGENKVVGGSNLIKQQSAFEMAALCSSQLRSVMAAETGGGVISPKQTEAEFLETDIAVNQNIKPNQPTI